MPLSIDLASPRLAVHRHHVCARVCVRATEARDFLYGSKSMSFLGKEKVESGFPAIEKNQFFSSFPSIKIEDGIEIFFLNKKLVKIIETFGWKLINYSEEEINHCSLWTGKFENEKIRYSPRRLSPGDKRNCVSFFPPEHLEKRRQRIMPARSSAPAAYCPGSLPRGRKKVY